MTNQKSTDNCDGENTQRRDQGIIQNKPSHMNQGNQTFRPDQQGNQSSGNRRQSQKGGQPQAEPSHKTS